ncbi:MAG: TssQ family T6SS-associated lipoprotein [Candidatus Nitrotoga sp.]
MTGARALILGMLLWLGGCQTFVNRLVGAGQVLFQGSSSERSVAQGIASYNNGDYQAAVVLLRHALEDVTLSKSNKISAHKYLAFTHCISVREKKCRESFERIFAINPDFNLTPAEAGHPVWGAVFREVRARKINNP